MRTKFFNCILLLFFCVLIATESQSQVRKLYLHPKTVARDKQTKFVDSLRFIPLEKKEGIELGTHYNTSVTRKYILLTDYMNKMLYVYSKEGKFVKSINYKKLGEGFYPGYKERTNEVTFMGNNKNYSLTAKDQIKIKLDWNNLRNRKYYTKFTIDLNDPTLTIKKGVPDEKDIVQINHFYGDYYMQGQISVSDLYKDSVDHEFKVYKDNKQVKAYFPYNRINEPRFLFTQENVGVSKTDTANIHFIARPYCDTIYKMVDDSLFPAYKLVLPLENSLPASFYTKPFKNRTERENFTRNNGWMMRQVHGFYETPKFIYFAVGYLSNHDFYIYEKQTDVTYKTKNIKADSSQYNLQLFASYGIMRDGDKFYKPQKASDLLTFFDQNKNVPVPKDLEEFIKSKPAANTPVIVEFKLKN